MELKKETLFEFTGPDFLARVANFMVLSLILINLLAFIWGFGIRIVGVVLGAGVVLGLMTHFGLRNSIVLTADSVTVTKKWFFLPYRK